MRGEVGHAWQRGWGGVCMVKGSMHGEEGGVHGNDKRGACVAKGCAWWGGACMAGGMLGRGHAWQRGAYMAKGACVHVGETATEAGSTHPTGMHSCSKVISVFPIFHAVWTNSSFSEQYRLILD